MGKVGRRHGESSVFRLQGCGLSGRAVERFTTGRVVVVLELAAGERLLYLVEGPICRASGRAGRMIDLGPRNVHISAKAIGEKTCATTWASVLTRAGADN